ncbi:MAG TPA: hypothetical protein ENK97_02305 [Campylobacteraceae bacterium]|nr:hypothetical protein [Campylobacteraceae bacterium]
MRKVLLSLFFLISLSQAEIYKVDHFESDIFSKKGNALKKVELSLIFEGENLSRNDYKLLDALNIIISSFYLEDLFTSKGKERFKKLLKQFLLKKYMLDIDAIYLLKFDIKPALNCDKLETLLQKIQSMQSEPAQNNAPEEKKAFEMLE